MKKKMISFLLLTLILTSTLNVAFIVRSSFAQSGENSVLGNDFMEKINETIPNKDTKPDQSNDLSDNWRNIYERKPDAKQNETLESSSQTSRYSGDKWNFNDTSEWSNFTYVNGNKTRLIVGVNGEQSTSLLELEKIAAKHQARIVNTVSIRGEVRAAVVELLLPSVTAFVEEVNVEGLANYIEPNMKVQAQLVPNDPYWSLQWGPQKIGADWAWNTTVGDPSVLVAVVDTGIDYTHPDLAANYVLLGYDWVNMDPDPLDDFGHGTHCAGIIAAVSNNNLGIAGLAQVRVMAEKVLDSGGGGYWDWVANGIINATDCGADIISMSLGGYGESELLHDAVKYAYDHGVLLVAAAGNDNTNTKFYPAAYDEVIAVAATDQSDGKAYFSNWGNWIELAAPGVDIYSTMPTYHVTMNDYGYSMNYSYMSGTSMACPHVAGVAALVWSRHPNKTRDWVRQWLRYTADDLGDPSFDVYYGYGRINARKAVEQTPPAHDLIAYEWTTPPYIEPGASGIINATVLNFGENNETNIEVQLFANDTVVYSALISLLAGGDSTKVSLTWNPKVEGLYNVTLYVVPVPGEANTENNVVSKYIYVGFPVKAVVLHSAGNVYGDIITNWQVLNNEWYLFGGTMVYIDYMTLNKDNISYDDIKATGADVLIISCAYDPYEGWGFTDSEIEAITQYVHEGHGLIATAGTLYGMVPNNNKLAPLFGLNETTMWSSTGTDLLHLLNTTHPIFANVPNPLVFPQVGTALPYDGRWDSNELAGGKYLALGHYQESAIVTCRGLVYISPWLEVIPPYYHHHLQLLYNAIVWSRYQRPQHDLAVSLQCPTHLHPGESVLVNATVKNSGLNNETDVELLLLVNGEQVANLTVPTLGVGESRAISYLWTPTLGAYNVTAYAPPIHGETETFNNVKTILLKVSYAVVIGFIETHGESLHSDDLKTYYQGLGYIVDTIHSPLTPELLAGYDVLIVGEDWYNTPWSSSEIAAVQGFISSGNGFVAVGDELASSVQTILLAYGISYTGFYGDSGSSNNFDHSHPIMEDVNYIYASAPVNSLQAVAPGYWIANDVSNMHMLIAGAETEGYVLCLSDDFAADLYAYDNKVMFTNIIRWMTYKCEHDLAVSLVAPTVLWLGNSAWLNATVRNRGLSNETDVELYLLINGTTVCSATIPKLLVHSSYVMTYFWTPALEATYNVTANTPPVLGENVTANNFVSKMVPVRYPPKLLVVDTPEAEDTGALDMLGYTYSLVTPEEFATVDLERYNVLFIGWMPGDTLVNALFARASEIANWVEAGNGIVALAEPYEVNRWAWLPLFVSDSLGYGDEVHIVDPAHPVMSDLTDAELSNWYTSYHGCFFNYDPSWQTLAEGLEVDKPVTMATTYGAGRIVITDQDPDYHLYYGRIEGAGKFLRNMIKWATQIPYKHELAVSLDVPYSLELGSSTLIRATVRNGGLNNETDVKLYLLINGTVVNSAKIPELLVGESYTITYFWTPTIKAIYNVTAYAPPVTGEEFTANNVVTRSVNVWLISVIGTGIFIDPLETTVMLGQNFTVSVNVANVTNLAGWQLNVTFNPAILNVNKIFLPYGNIFEGLDPRPPGKCIDNKLGYVMWGCCIGPDAPVNNFNGSGTMCEIEFATVGLGTSSLHIDTEGDFCTLLVDPDVNELPFTPIDGNANVVEYVPVHDVAIIEVTPSKTKAYAGQIVNITVIAKNEGDFPETFNITAYYDITPIETETIYDLAPGTSFTLIFAWNTRHVPPCVNYTIWAEAATVPGEIDTTDNTLTDGKVKIKLMGDINGDGKVDIKDLVLLIKSFGSYPSHPRWNADADVNGDGKVDIKDLVLLVKNYGIIP